MTFQSISRSHIIFLKHPYNNMESIKSILYNVHRNNKSSIKQGVNMKTVLCFGDSNTWGCVPKTGQRFAADKRWTGVLRLKLGSGFTVIEEGLNGRTTIFDDPDFPFRSGKDYLPPCLNSHAPVDLVIVMLGTNDLKDKFNLSLDDIAAGMETLIDIIQNSAAGVYGASPEVLIICPPHIARSTDFDVFLHSYFNSTRLSACYAPLAEKHNCFFLDASRFIQESDLPDGIHLSEAAHAALGEKAAKMVTGILD